MGGSEGPQQHLPWGTRLQHDLYLCVRHWGPREKGGCRGFTWILLLMCMKESSHEAWKEAELVQLFTGLISLKSAGIVFTKFHVLA